MLYQQWKQFTADLKTGTPPNLAIAKLDMTQSDKKQIARLFANAASSAVVQAQSTLVEAVSSASAAPNAKMPSMNIDWKLVNDDAKKWAQEYAYTMISSITATSRRVLQERVSAWIASGNPLSTLAKDDKLVQMFGPMRAKLIASTEVTRIYAEANQRVFEQTGVEKRRWNTAKDELVCPICGPLNGVEVGIAEPFPGGLSLPPAHPRCRCWITPVVGPIPAATPPPEPATGWCAMSNSSATT